MVDDAGEILPIVSGTGSNVLMFDVSEQKITEKTKIHNFIFWKCEIDVLNFQCRTPFNKKSCEHNTTSQHSLKTQ